jgi:hypothetical protein
LETVDFVETSFAIQAVAFHMKRWVMISVTSNQSRIYGVSGSLSGEHSSLGYVSPAAFETAHWTRNQEEQIALH